MATIFNSNINKRLDQYLSNSKKKSYFVLAVTVIFILIIFLFGIRPAITSSIRQYNDNKERKVAITSLESKLNSLQSLTEQENTSLELLNYFQYVLPNEDRGDYILKEIYNYVEGNNIDISSVQWIENQDQFEQLTNFAVGPQINSHLFNIEGSGNIEDIISFISVIENSRRIYNIRSIQIFPVNAENLDLFKDMKPFTFNMEIQYFNWNKEVVKL